VQDDDFEPRPNDYLVEPMFAPLEPKPKKPRSPWYRRLVAWLLRRPL